MWKPEAACSMHTARWPVFADDNINRDDDPFVGANEPTSEVLRIVSRDAEWTRERDCPTVNVCFTRLLRDYVRRGASGRQRISRANDPLLSERLFRHVFERETIFSNSRFTETKFDSEREFPRE